MRFAASTSRRRRAASFALNSNQPPMNEWIVRPLACARRRPARASATVTDLSCSSTPLKPAASSCRAASSVRRGRMSAFLSCVLNGARASGASCARAWRAPAAPAAAQVQRNSLRFIFMPPFRPYAFPGTMPKPSRGSGTSSVSSNVCAVNAAFQPS